MMDSKEAEYRHLFLTEANENYEKLNHLFIELEKDPSSRNAINGIFRIVHTLKGNAMLMGYDRIASLAHTMEDVFSALSEKKIKLSAELIQNLFKANDKLGALINAIESGEKVSFLGIRTKLTVYLKNELEGGEGGSEEGDESAGESEESEKSEEGEGEDDEGESEGSSSITFTDAVQIPVRKMDELLNLVGELVIERDRLIAIYGADGTSTLEFEGLKRISANLHYSVMNVRMVQMGFLFSKFHRILRDAATSVKKDVKLVLKGTEVEIDRNILKIISDSLIHIVRNSVGHGIETAEEREAAGKSKEGTVTLEAKHEKDSVILTVSDDGRGIDTNKIRKKVVEKKMISADVAEKLRDAEIIRYIFEPGFSSADSVTAISGRGVGMDVVKRSVESIGGQVLINTELGKGTSIHLLLPSSLALKAALLFDVAEQEYAIPLAYIESVEYFTKKDIHKISNGLMVNYQGQTVSVVFLKDLIEVPDLMHVHDEGVLQESFEELADDVQLNVIMASHSGRNLGLIVDRLQRQKEIIEKKLPKPIDTGRLLSGTTILGSGNVCPVIDVASIMDVLYLSGTSVE
jgi:two-component system chemotaxis sensor kinase CheA